MFAFLISFFRYKGYRIHETQFFKKGEFIELCEWRMRGWSFRETVPKCSTPPVLTHPVALLSRCWLHSQVDFPDTGTVMITSSSRLIFYLGSRCY